MSRLFGVLVLCFCFGGLPVSAQIVNVQARFGDQPEPGLHGALEGALDWRTGSNDFLTVGGAFTLQWSVEDHLVLGLVQGEYGISNGEQTLGRSLEHLRYRYRFTDVVSLESFLQHEYTPFRRLALRALAGIGPRFHLVDGEVFGAVAGVAAMVEHERLGMDDLPDAGMRTTDLRLSSYLLGRLKVLEGLSVVETLYLQPKVTQPSDFRILNETALVAKANERVALSVSLIVHFDRAPPAGVAPLDTQVRSTLGVSF